MTTEQRRVALVTGASRGIGAATALALAAEGYDVAVAARSAAALDDVVTQIETRGVSGRALQADLSNREDVAGLIPAVLEQWGRMDVLVNNAGLLPAAARAQEISYEDFEYVQEVNLTAPWFLACRARDAMVATGGGVIVNLTSTAAYYPTVGLVHYNCSKAALTMLTRALALEWARDAIRVVGIAPGRIDTDLVQPILEHDAAKGRRPNPLNRVGRPEEVADLISFLVSDRASYITGGIVSIDGGELIAVPYSQ